MLDGAAAFVPSIATLGFSTGEIEPPGIVLGSPDLGMDEAIDGFVADGCGGILLAHLPGDLFGGETLLEFREDLFTQLVIAFETCAFPTPGLGLSLCVGGLISDLAAAIAIDFARDA